MSLERLSNEHLSLTCSLLPGQKSTSSANQPVDDGSRHSKTFGLGMSCISLGGCLQAFPDIFFVSSGARLP